MRNTLDVWLRELYKIQKKIEELSKLEGILPKAEFQRRGNEIKKEIDAMRTRYKTTSKEKVCFT